jgi:DNA-directed RNA polymerase subunit alpha
VTEQELNARLAMSLPEIGLSVRLSNMLERNDVLTVDDLLNCTCEDLMEIPNIGKKALAEIFRALDSLGFTRRKA